MEDETPTIPASTRRHMTLAYDRKQTRACCHEFAFGMRSGAIAHSFCESQLQQGATARAVVTSYMQRGRRHIEHLGNNTRSHKKLARLLVACLELTESRRQNARRDHATCIVAKDGKSRSLISRTRVICWNTKRNDRTACAKVSKEELVRVGDLRRDHAS